LLIGESAAAEADAGGSRRKGFEHLRLGRDDQIARQGAIGDQHGVNTTFVCCDEIAEVFGEIVQLDYRPGARPFSSARRRP
jgi:hypothetical protein